MTRAQAIAFDIPPLRSVGMLDLEPFERTDLEACAVTVGNRRCLTLAPVWRS